MYFQAFFLLLHLPLAWCDYSCICNYNVEKTVFSTMDENVSPTGYLYEFDCKQQLVDIQTQSGWYAIAFEHKISYVHQDSQIQIQTCPGSPPTDDIVTTLQPSTVQESSTTPDTLTSPSTQLLSSPDTASPNPTTVSVNTQSTATVLTGLTETATTAMGVSMPSSFSTVTFLVTNPSAGNKTVCPSAIEQISTPQDIPFQYNGDCYLIVSSPLHWLQAELHCNSAGGHLFHISSKEDQAFFYNYLRNYFNHSVWTGLNDQLTEGSFRWSSGSQVTFLNWANHSHFSDVLEDCVVMDLHEHGGKWDDRECLFELYSFICQFDAQQGLVQSTLPPPTGSVAQSTSDGNIALCPTAVQHHAALYGYVLGQYERGCYELLLDNRVTWEHAENICQSRGGHLAHISNAQQQTFVEGFMQRHNPNHAVWLGLHDTVQEGNFQWTAGNAFEYSNWIPGHIDNTFGGHNNEDCVVFIPQRQGYWDDVSCGYQEIFAHDYGEIHYAFCQYKIAVSSISIVG